MPLRYGDGHKVDHFNNLYSGGSLEIREMIWGGPRDMYYVIKKRRILISTISLLDNDYRCNVVILNIIGQS